MRYGSGLEIVLVSFYTLGILSHSDFETRHWQWKGIQFLGKIINYN